MKRHDVTDLTINPLLTQKYPKSPEGQIRYPDKIITVKIISKPKHRSRKWHFITFIIRMH